MQLLILAAAAAIAAKAAAAAADWCDSNVSDAASAEAMAKWIAQRR
jgi:hypothetical protein